jgi:hypothetical protein
MAAWLDGPVRDALPQSTLDRVKARLHRPRRGDGRGQPRALRILQRSVAKLARAGAKVALGSDTGTQDNPFGITDHRELEMLVEAGHDADAGAGRGHEHVRRLSGPEGQGRDRRASGANFVVLDANPLEDITNTRRIGECSWTAARSIAPRSRRA